jgi:Putative DNA-binding domain
MALLDISLDRIGANDLQRLIDTQAVESVYIDYKAATYGRAPENHREFLADISSFANTAGGDLVIGMTEANGIPNGFNPFPVHPEPELRRLDDMARSGLQPRISNLRTRAVLAPTGGYVIIVRIPRSYDQPHRVVHSSNNLFWARSSASPKRYEPNVEELRRIFNESSLLGERIRAFRIERLTKIADKEAVNFVAGKCLLVLHVLPYSGFNLGSSQSVAELEKQWQLFPPLGCASGTHRHVNFDGFVVLSSGSQVSQQHSYAQVFRSGAVEAASTIERNDGNLLATTIAKYCVQGTKSYVDALTKFDIGCPIAILASLIGAKGKSLESGIMDLYAPYGQVTIIEQEQLHFVEVILENIPRHYDECASALLPLLEQVWNTAGFPSPPLI